MAFEGENICCIRVGPGEAAVFVAAQATPSMGYDRCDPVGEPKGGKKGEPSSLPVLVFSMQPYTGRVTMVTLRSSLAAVS